MVRVATSIFLDVTFQALSTCWLLSNWIFTVKDNVKDGANDNTKDKKASNKSVSKFKTEEKESKPASGVARLRASLRGGKTPKKERQRPASLTAPTIKLLPEG